MTEHQTLGRFLADFGAGDEMGEAVARTVAAIADSCCAIAEVIALGPLGGSLGATRGENPDGDAQAALDVRANEIVIVIAGNWKPLQILGAALVFGFLESLQLNPQGLGQELPYQIFLALPYIVAIFILIRGRMRSEAPLSLGVPYLRE